MLIASSITFNVSGDYCLRVWQRSPSRNGSKFSSSSRFGCPGHSLSLRSKSPLLNRLSQSLHVVSNRKFSPYASWSKRRPSATLFSKLKQKNQTFPHMLLRWFKTWRFRYYKKFNVYKWIHSQILNIVGYVNYFNTVSF